MDILLVSALPSLAEPCGSSTKKKQGTWRIWIDIRHLYWQIPLDPKSRQYIEFIVPFCVQLKVIPFGIHSAVASFQPILNTIISPELHSRVSVYRDNITVLCRFFEEHLENLISVFN